MNCREFRKSGLEGSLSDPGRSHLGVCGRCREARALVHLRAALLTASGFTGTLREPDASFYYMLRRRLRQASTAEEKDAWLHTLRLARAFMTAAVIILVVITGLNVYVARRSSAPIVGLDSYWRDASGDGEGIVLSDEAITHEQVLKSLIALRGANGK